jgi:hypothetical protein
MLDHFATMKEYVSIRLAVHPGWSGDHVLNAEVFVARIYRDMPEEAATLAVDIRRNLDDWSEQLGVSKGRLEFIAKQLLGELNGGSI